MDFVASVGWSSIDPRVLGIAKQIGDSASYSLENVSDLIALQTRGEDLVDSVVPFDGAETMSPEINKIGGSISERIKARKQGEPARSQMDWYNYCSSQKARASKLAEAPAKGLGLTYMNPRKERKEPLKSVIARAEIGAGLTVQPIEKSVGPEIQQVGGIISSAQSTGIRITPGPGCARRPIKHRP